MPLATTVEIPACAASHAVEIIDSTVGIPASAASHGLGIKGPGRLTRLAAWMLGCSSRAGVNVGITLHGYGTFAFVKHTLRRDLRSYVEGTDAQTLQQGRRIHNGTTMRNPLCTGWSNHEQGAQLAL